jgi:hypothetical protein
MIWLSAIILPPVWAAIGIIALYGNRSSVDDDVVVMMLWISITMTIYTYSFPISLIETFGDEN